MYAIAKHSQDLEVGAPADPIEQEIEEIEDLRSRTLANRELLHYSPAARYLVDKEIPRLVGIIRQLRQSEPGEGGLMSSGRWAHGLLTELQQQVSILRDLVDRR